MFFSHRSAKRLFPFSSFSILFLCAGILLMPFASGCSGKKKPKSVKTVSKKKTAKKPVKGSPKKAAAAKTPVKKKPGKTAKPAIPAVFSRLTSYEGISLDEPFPFGETETLVKIDPAKGVRICDTKRLPEGKIILDAATLRLVRLETKKQYEGEKEAAAAFEARKTALEKTLALPPMRGGRGVVFTEMISDGRGRSLQVILSGSAVQEIMTVQAMPRSAAPLGKPISGLFGLTLGRPIPENQISGKDMILFHPDPPRDEFVDYNYFNDERGNVQSILANSDPQRTFRLADALAVVSWLEETFAMQMSYDSENAETGIFRYSSEGRVLELSRREGKMTLSIRISLSNKKK